MYLCFAFVHVPLDWYTGWNDKIAALEKTTWFHFCLMKSGFLFYCRPSTSWPVVYNSQEKLERMAAIRLALVLWEVMLVIFSTYGQTREGYKVVALLLKPSLGIFGLVGRRRVLLPHPESATGHLIAPGDHLSLQHIQVHFGVDFQGDFEDVRWHDVALTWNHTKNHKRSRKLCFHRPGHIERSGFAFWRCCQWSCCHNLDR